MTTKYANLTNDQCDEIENTILDLNIMVLGDGEKPKTALCEEVRCPVCGNPLTIYTSGKSYVISCEDDGIIVSFRGFSNPSYFNE